MLSKNESWNWNQHKLESNHFFLEEISGANSCVQRYQPKLTAKYYQKFLCSLKSDAWSEMVDRARWWIEEEQTFACFSKPENLPRLSAFVHKLWRGIRDRPPTPQMNTRNETLLSIGIPYITLTGICCCIYFCVYDEMIPNYPIDIFASCQNQF